MVGGLGFEPGASRSRTVVAHCSRRAARGRLGSPDPSLQSAMCCHVTTEAARVATSVATRFCAIPGPPRGTRMSDHPGIVGILGVECEKLRRAALNGVSR